MAVLMFTTSFKVAEWCLFVLGICANGRWVVAYVYFTEFLAEDKTKRYGPIVNSTAALSIIIGAFTFQVVTKDSFDFEVFAVC